MSYIYPCWFKIWIFYDQGWVIYIQVGLRSEYFCLKAVAHFLQFKTIKSKMMLISTYLITVSRVPLRIRHVLLLDGWSLEIYNSSLYDQTLVRYKTKFESCKEYSIIRIICEKEIRNHNHSHKKLLKCQNFKGELTNWFRYPMWEILNLRINAWSPYERNC